MAPPHDRRPAAERARHAGLERRLFGRRRSGRRRRGHRPISRAGDLVACAGAGQANHADYISVKRNLVCRVPAGCPVNLAASTTVGAIALQGVRRAAPQLGERVVRARSRPDRPDHGAAAARVRLRRHRPRSRSRRASSARAALGMDARRERRRCVQGARARRHRTAAAPTGRSSRRRPSRTPWSTSRWTSRARRARSSSSATSG